MPSDRTASRPASSEGHEFFYVPPDQIAGSEARIEGSEFAHLTQVMRHRIGDRFDIVDGMGIAYSAVLTRIQGKVAVCSLLSRHELLHEPTVRLTLAVGLLKNPARFELMVEKCTELGVSTIVPLTTSRTIARHARSDRWQNIALAAMKQCGRCKVPVISPLLPFTQWVPTFHGERFILHEQATESLPQIVLPPETGHTIAVCIGPEGGFTENEVAEAQRTGWRAVSLGSRRLRSETAAITAVARLLA
jgi:16S rRNA (uracil1498-N3)-methyltransferase